MMMLRRLAVLPLLLVLFARCAAAADIVVVHKKDGSRIEGEIMREDAGWVEVKTRFGRIKVFRTDFLRIEKGVSRETELKQKRSAIADSDAVGLMNLASWCAQNKMPREAMALYTAATTVAGPHYLDANLRLAKLALSLNEYRVAVERYLDLAVRLKQDDAWDALKRAEDSLRRERLAVWRRANDELLGKRYGRAILGYCEALACTVHDDPQVEGDVGRAQIRQRILETRKLYFEDLRQHLKTGTLLDTDPGGISWHYSPRPENLRRQSWSISMQDLQLETERYVARWLAVHGTLQAFSAWDTPAARAIEIAPGGHPDIAVAAYAPAAGKIHAQVLASRPKGDVYLEELIASYPYEGISSAAGLLAVGREVVCYGRLRKRETLLPQYVLEIWAVESVQDPQAVHLADCLKRQLSCAFEETPLADVLAHIEMLSQARVEFSDGKVPDVPITLSLSEEPAGLALSRIAKELGLQWTRRNACVLMKKDLTDEETLLQNQVMRLATDRAGK